MPPIDKIVSKLENEYGKPARRRGKPLDVLVATILSQNTTDKNSSRAFKRLKARFPSWEKVAAASAKSIEASIRIGGLPQIKAKRIKKALREIKKREGKLSLARLKMKNSADTFSYLTSLDGVGPKTAACVLAFAFGKDSIPADTHVHRLSNRLGLVDTKSPAKTQEALENAVPAKHKHSLHLNLIHHGRTVCRAQKPKCPSCFLTKICPKIGVEESS